ncbi:unnamed protein product, partial [marine sediment metagenome]
RGDSEELFEDATIKVGSVKLVGADRPSDDLDVPGLQFDPADLGY